MSKKLIESYIFGKVFTIFGKVFTKNVEETHRIIHFWKRITIFSNLI